MNKIRKRIEKRIEIELRADRGSDEVLSVLLGGGALSHDPKAVSLARELAVVVLEEDAQLYAQFGSDKVPPEYDRQFGKHPAWRAYLGYLNGEYFLNHQDDRKMMVAYIKKLLDDKEYRE